MNKRINIFKYIMYLLFIIIAYRLFYLQIINREYYNNLLNKKTIETVSLQAPRGRIYDKNMRLLVDNSLQMTITYKKDISLSRKDEINLSYKVSEYLTLDYDKLTNSYLKDFYLLIYDDEIKERIKDKYQDYQKHLISEQELYQIKKDAITSSDLEKFNDKDKKAIYLYYLMNNGYSYEDKIIEENALIEEFMLFSENNQEFPGFKTKYTYQREYLYGDTLKSILGYVGNIPRENKDYYLNKGYKLSDKVGLSNLELIYDDYLRGKDEVYKIFNREMYLYKDGEKGNDLVITIDIELQRFVDQVLSEEILLAKKQNSTRYYNHSYVLISDTKGSVLTISGREYFNGKIIDRGIGNITDTMTPGSVVKGVSMLIGYDLGVIKMGEVLKDECLKIRNTPLKCSYSTMGYINDLEALQRSSNVYQFLIAIKVGKGIYKYNQPLNIRDEAFSIYRDYFSQFGLGVNTGIDLLNESRGYKGSSHLPGLLLDFSIGQYDTYTNIQLNQYISTIATRGTRYKMHLLDRVYQNNQEIYVYEPSVLNEVNIKKEYFERVILGLSRVITNGTGYGYVNSSYKAAAKTGTSESFMDTNNDGIIDKESNSTSFAMFMPYDNPKIAISMMSPNISYQNYYTYGINKRVIKRITDNIYKYIDLT